MANKTFSVTYYQTLKDVFCPLRPERRENSKMRLGAEGEGGGRWATKWGGGQHSGVEGNSGGGGLEALVGGLTVGVGCLQPLRTALHTISLSLQNS